MAMGRPRAFCTETVLDRAMEVFWRRGYEGASVADLTSAMGINPPSLYAAFGSKAGLFRAVLDRYGERRASFMESVMAAPTGYEAVRRLLFGSADLATAPDEPPGCLLTASGVACGDDPALPEELSRRRAISEQMLRQRLERAREEGDLPADADPAGLARFVTTVTGGMGVQAADGMGRAELRQVAETALAAFGRFDPSPLAGEGVIADDG